MRGLIGKKLGMTSIFNDQGMNIACTVIEAGPCVVTQVKTEDQDGYNAVQMGFGERKEKNTPNALKGHFKKSGTTPKHKVVEFRNFEVEKKEGDTVGVEILEVGDMVDIAGTSKGKGFQGVVKRHGFAGVGMATHGQHNRLRAPGSIGMSSTPSRVWKGMRMAGRMGGKRVKGLDLEIVKIMADRNIVLVKGSVPGKNGSFVIIEA